MHVVHAMSSGRFAGVEQYVARLAAAQAAAGHRVEVVGGEPRATAAAAGPDVRTSPAGSVRELMRGLRALPGRPDVVNAHMTDAELAVLLTSGRTPVVATRHFAAPRGATAPRRLGLGIVRSLLAAQISVSRYVADAIDQPSTVVHAGVPERAPATPTGRSVLLLGRLEVEKRADLAVRAFAESDLAEQGWTLSVVGDGAERGALERHARDLGLGDAVRFHGQVDDPSPFLATATAMVAPCEVEAFGLAVVEAMAHGLPVVAARAGGHLETVGAVCPSLLFPPRDATAAGTLLRELVLDTGRLRACGELLRQEQQLRFTLDRQVRATTDVYEAASA